MKLLSIGLAWLLAAGVCLVLFTSGIETYHRYEGPDDRYREKSEYVGETLPGQLGADWHYAGEVSYFERQPERRALACIGVITAALLFSVRVLTRRPR